MEIATLSDLYTVLAIAAIVISALLGLIGLKIKAISHETSPNSGGSMKDKVNLTYELVQQIAHTQQEWRAEQARHNDRLYEADKRVHVRLDEHIRDHIGGVT